MQFSSDNAESWAPEILAALADAETGAMASYGGDALTHAVTERFTALFEKDVAVFLVATGTAANGLAFASLCPPYGAIFAHEAAHVQVDECGAPEFFTGGAKMVPLPGASGKIDPGAFRASLDHFLDGFVHHSQPRILSLTQATEAGTVYTADEIKALSAIAKGRDMAVHIDGARFANALANLGCTPAEATWKAGVDVMSFGATKNGCLAAEAVIFFDPKQAGAFEYYRKRAGQLFSKHRVLAAQMLAYLESNRWLALAAHANAMATRLGDGLAAIDGVRVWYPVEANEVFPSFPHGVAAGLSKAGAVFHPWAVPGDPAAGQMHRLVTSFKTTEEDVDRFLAHTRALCAT